MGKYNCFAFLKMVLCFLCFSIGGVILGVEVNEPDSINVMTGRNFYVEYDRDTRLFYVMERVTKDNVDLWKKRLAYEDYTLYKLLEIKEMANGSIGYEFFLKHFIPLYADFAVEIEKNLEFMGLFSAYDITRPEVIGRFLQDTDSEDGIKRFHEANARFWSKIKELDRFDFLRSKYFDAFSAFSYNLSHYTDGGEGATWVAYVTSIQPVLSSEKGFDVASRDIMMLVTVKISEDFYATLGIFRSLIAETLGNKLTRTGNLTMPFQAAIARMVGQIMPSAKWLAFRPLKSVREAIEKSGIRYSLSTTGEMQNTNLPYITYEGGYSRSCFKSLSNFTLVEPGTSFKDTVYYRISDKHWFSTNPFSGGADSLELDAFTMAIGGGVTPRDQFKSNPFVVVDRVELGEYGVKLKVRNFVSDVLSKLK